MTAQPANTGSRCFSLKRTSCRASHSEQLGSSQDRPSLVLLSQPLPDLRGPALSNRSQKVPQLEEREEREGRRSGPVRQRKTPAGRPPGWPPLHCTPLDFLEGMTHISSPLGHCNQHHLPFFLLCSVGRRRALPRPPTPHLHVGFFIDPFYAAFTPTEHPA
jgi:hypothetical protein